MDKNAYNCYLINFLGFILVPFTPGTRHFCSGPAESGKIGKGTSMNFDYFFYVEIYAYLCILDQPKKNKIFRDKKFLPRNVTMLYPRLIPGLSRDVLQRKKKLHAPTKTRPLGGIPDYQSKTGLSNRELSRSGHKKVTSIIY